MYDGGGIEPDIVTKDLKFNTITSILVTKYLIFNYANQFAYEHDSVASPDVFEITDDMYEDFLAFLEDKEYDYKTKSEKALENLEKNAKKENYFEALESEFEALEQKLMHDKNEDLRKHEAEIKRILKEEILSRYYFQKGRIISSLKDDSDLDKAIEILEGKDTYVTILDGSYEDAGESN